MNMTGTLTVDVSFDEKKETLRDVLHGMRSGLSVTFRETGVTGGGGWPEVEFTGPVAHLGVVASRYAGDDLGALGDALNWITTDKPADAKMASTISGS